MNVFKPLLLSLVLIGACWACADDKHEGQGTNSLPTEGIGLRQLHLDLNEKTGTDSIAGVLSERTTVILRMRGANDPIDLSLMTIIERNGDNGSVRLRVEDDQLTSIPLQPYYVNYILYSKKDIVSKTTVPMDSISLGLCLDLSDADNIQVTNRYSPSLRTSGSGVDIDPIVILDYTSFMNNIISPLMAGETHEGKYFRISCDSIDLSKINVQLGRTDWSPAGYGVIDGTDTDTPFKGNIDGGMCLIHGLISTNQSYSGLFHTIENATIKNIEFEINLRSNSNVGSIAYSAINSSIDNVILNGTMHADRYAGGYFAIAQNVTITNCKSGLGILNNDAEASDDDECIGGYVGSAGVITIKNSVLKGSMSCQYSDCVGGFIGKVSTKIKEGTEVAAGTVILERLASVCDIKGRETVGGFIGYLHDMALDSKDLFLGFDKISDPNPLRADFIMSSINGNGSSIGGMIGSVNSLNQLLRVTNYRSYNHSNEIKTDKLRGSIGGLFGTAGSSKTELNNISVYGMVVSGGVNSGGLCGNLSGTLVIKGTVDVSFGRIKGLRAGGLFGEWNATMDISAGKILVNTAVVSENVTSDNYLHSGAGSIIGITEGDIKGMDFSKIVFMADVVVQGFNAGGLIGNVKDLTTCTINNFDNTKLHGFKIWGVYAGGLVGFAKGIVNSDNCKLKLSMELLPDQDHQYSFGGMVGSSSGHSMNITNGEIELMDVSIDSDLEGNLGGIAGCTSAGNNGQISNCTVKDIRIWEKHSKLKGVGGILGEYCNTGSRTTFYIRSCKSIGSSKLTGAENVGGIVGYNNDGENTLVIEKCLNLTPIECRSYGCGGIVGNNRSILHVRYSGNRAKIQGVNEVSGIVGGVNNAEGQETRIDECYNDGEIKGTSEMGGLIGVARQDITIRNSYNTAYIASGTNVGGLVGYFQKLNNVCELHRCFNIASTGYGTIGGVDKEKDEDNINAQNLYYANNGGDYTYAKGKMYSSPIDSNKLTDENTFGSSNGGFDFDNIWFMGSRYPMLRNVIY